MKVSWPLLLCVLVSYVLVSFLVVVVIGEQELCSRARNKCVVRMGCSMALSNYYMSCGPLIHGRSADQECTPQCKKALISLLSTEDGEGEDMMTCDCNGSSFCLQHKERMKVCDDEVLTAMKTIYNHSTQISCSLATLICSADTSCVTALRYYNRHCTRLFTGDKCTSRCNNSLAILYRQAKAQKLRNCRCDGKEDWKVGCNTLQHNTERLCFGHRHRHGNHHRNHTRGGSSPSSSHATNVVSRDHVHSDEKIYQVNDSNSGVRTLQFAGSHIWLLCLLLTLCSARLWPCR